VGLPSYTAVRFDSAESGEGQAVRRYDRGELKSPTKTPEGFIRAEGFVARAGVFRYQRADGTPFTELRHPDEVFHPEAIASFALVPLTLEHPPKNLLPGIVRDYQVGSVGQPRRDGDRLRTDILITDPKAISAAESGVTGLSGGYDTLVFPVAGTWTDENGREHRFDSYQTRIRGNHVAQTESPRLGTDIRMRMDSTDAVQRDEIESPALAGTGAQPRAGAAMAKIKIGEVEHEVPEAVASAYQQLQGRADAAEKAPRQDADVAALNRKIDQMQGALDAATADLKSRQDAEKQAKVRATEEAAIASKAEIVVKAAAVLKRPIADLARMDSNTLMREVVKAESPDTPIDGKSDEYVAGIFQHVTSRIDSSKAMGDALNASKDKTQQEAQRRADAAKQSGGNVAKEARTKMLKEAESAWKTAPASTPAS
jgi:hypothetical protein